MYIKFNLFKSLFLDIGKGLVLNKNQAWKT